MKILSKSEREDVTKYLSRYNRLTRYCFSILLILIFLASGFIINRPIISIILLAPIIVFSVLVYHFECNVDLCASILNADRINRINLKSRDSTIQDER